MHDLNTWWTCWMTRANSNTITLILWTNVHSSKNKIIIHLQELIKYCKVMVSNVMQVIKLTKIVPCLIININWVMFPLIKTLGWDFDVCFSVPLFQKIANWCDINHIWAEAQLKFCCCCVDLPLSSPISRWRLNPGSDRRDHEGVRADRTTKEWQLNLKCVWCQCKV